MTHHTYKGIFPILYTFFNEDGSIDKAAMKRQVDVCINAGAHGIVILGIVGEFDKLNVNEKRKITEIVAEAINGRVPLAVTVSEPSVPGQIEFMRAAEQIGADWTILQPPQLKGIPEIEIIRFFGAIAEHATKPVALQNNPVNLNVWLTNESLKTVNRNHPNVNILKGEGPIPVVQKLMEETDGVFDVFTGLGGREMTLTHALGCVGCIPAPDCIDIQCRMFELLDAGDKDGLKEAELIHQSILPMIQFALHSSAHMLAYGKQMFAWRAGIKSVHSRAPAIAPNPYNLGLAKSFVQALPSLD
ncbi:MAG: dihydrodipicolinate synthase family protein [Rhodospirillales bacterium]|nr:dihydrodipicolinate synthase family protein [Rhodospirillales bacterium]